MDEDPDQAVICEAGGGPVCLCLSISNFLIFFFEQRDLGAWSAKVRDGRWNEFRVCGYPSSNRA